MGVVYNPFNGTLTLIPNSGSSSGTVKYFSTFVVADWVSSAPDYTITIPAATHNISNPTVTVYEKNGTDYDQVFTVVSVNASNDIIIKTSSNPDNRFDGLVVIV
jgi:hypothetical protein